MIFLIVKTSGQKLLVFLHGKHPSKITYNLMTDIQFLHQVISSITLIPTYKSFFRVKVWGFKVTLNLVFLEHDTVSDHYFHQDNIIK